MSDWAVGDLAVCVDDENAQELKVGASYRVVGLIHNGRRRSGKRDLGLVLSGVAMPPPYKGFWHGLFRKILPDKHESCEAEFVTLLRRIKRKVSA